MENRRYFFNVSRGLDAIEVMLEDYRDELRMAKTIIGRKSQIFKIAKKIGQLYLIRSEILRGRA